MDEWMEERKERRNNGCNGKNLGLPVCILGYQALPHFSLHLGHTLSRSEEPSWKNSTTGWGSLSVWAEHMDQMGGFRKRDFVFILLFYYCSEYAFLFPFPAPTSASDRPWVWIDLPGSFALGLQARSVLLFIRWWGASHPLPCPGYSNDVWMRWEIWAVLGIWAWFLRLNIPRSWRGSYNSHIPSFIWYETNFQGGGKPSPRVGICCLLAVWPSTS